MTGWGGSSNQVDLCVQHLLLHFEKSRLRRFGHLGRKPVFGVVVATADWRETTEQDMVDMEEAAGRLAKLIWR